MHMKHYKYVSKITYGSISEMTVFASKWNDLIIKVISQNEALYIFFQVLIPYTKSLDIHYH